MLRRAALVLVLLAGGLTAAAQPAPSPTPSTRGPQMFRVARISPWLDATHPFVAVVQITNKTELALQDVSVRVATFGRIISRSQLSLAIDHGASTPLVGLTSDRVPGDIAPGEQRTVKFVRAVPQLARLSATGVYPFEIDVRWTGGTENVTTAVPFITGNVFPPINIAWLCSVARPTLRRSDGVYPNDAVTALETDQLRQQMNVIAAHPGVGVTLAPSPSLLDELADMSDGFATRSFATVQAHGKETAEARSAAAALDAIKRAATAAGEIATVPYAAADLPRLLQHGLRADLLHQVTLGRSVTETRLGRAPSLAAFFPPTSRVDEDTLNALATIGISGVVTRRESLATPPAGPFQPQNFGASRPVTLDVAGTSDVPALIADDGFSQRASSQEQGVLAGQAIVAMTATAWLELPLFSPERAILIAPPAIMAPPAFASAISGLSSAPWVRVRTVSDTLSSLPPRSSAALAKVATRDKSYLRGARSARRALSTLAQIVTSAPPELDTLDRYVLLSESDEWSADEAAGAGLARAVVLRVRAVTRAVRVVPRQVTLTSRKGSVPVTLVNGNDFALNVRVKLDSTRVSFPSGASRTLDLLPPNKTIDFAIQALATGAFPIDVRVESPDGHTVLATGRVIVRSTAVSAVALATVGGGALFLLLGSMRRRRKRAPAR